MELKSGEFALMAGQMTVKDKIVHASKDRGILRFYINSETTLLTFEWKNLNNNQTSEPIVITAGDWCYKNVQTKKGHPFYFENVSYPDDKYFFYYQEPKDKIPKIEEKIKLILEKGELKPDSNAMEVEETKKPSTTQNNQENQKQAVNFLKSFGDIMKKMQQKYPSLIKILTREKITQLFEKLNDDEKKRLYDLLPKNQQNAEGFLENIRSAQFRQGCGSLSHALQSENLQAIISSFGLDMKVAQQYTDGVEAFVKCIVDKFSPKEDKKEDKKEEKKDEKK